jgi:hypothetical protein
MSDYAKFQWSMFSPDGRSEQVVVRSDDAVEWAENIDIAKKQLPKVGFPNDSGNQATVGQPEAPTCSVHNKPMRNGPYGWFCATNTNPDKTGKPMWCKEKPPIEFARE